MGRPPMTERNTQVVYDATVSMMTVREIADKYGISEARVYQILRDQSKQGLPEDVHTAMHSIGLTAIKRAALEIVNAQPAAMFDVKGNPLYDPITGDAVRDHTARLKAMEAYQRADAEQRKLYARDAPRKQEIILSEKRNEMEQYMDALRMVASHRPDLLEQAS